MIFFTLINLFDFILDAFFILNLIYDFFYFLKLIVINKFEGLYKNIRYIIVIAKIIKFK